MLSTGSCTKVALYPFGDGELAAEIVGTMPPVTEIDGYKLVYKPRSQRNSNPNSGVITVVSKFIASQLKQPSGAFGRFLTGRLLNKFNATINQLTVELAN